MPYDADGEPVRPEDVLDREELAEHYRARRSRHRRASGFAGRWALYTDDPFYNGPTQPPPEE